MLFATESEYEVNKTSRLSIGSQVWLKSLWPPRHHYSAVTLNYFSPYHFLITIFTFCTTGVKDSFCLSNFESSIFFFFPFWPVEVKICQFFKIFLKTQFLLSLASPIFVFYYSLYISFYSNPIFLLLFFIFCAFFYLDLTFSVSQGVKDK